LNNTVTQTANFLSQEWLLLLVALVWCLIYEGSSGKLAII